tara:strand:+ start:418 stop:603 length:186 start_codon:yes stop_codon:yes gene_type:complete
LGESKLPGDLKEGGLSLFPTPFPVPAPFELDCTVVVPAGVPDADVIPLYNIYNKYKLNTSS